MQFSVTKADLCRCLSLVSGVVAKKSTIPVLSNVRLHADGDTLTVTGTDLEVGITVTTAAQVETPGASTLPAKRLLDFVRLLPDGDVKFKFNEQSWATITAGRSRTRIPGMGVESFPEMPAVASGAFSIAAESLARLIHRVRFAISKEQSRFTLYGALMEVSGDNVRMVATDGHRLALGDAPCPGSGAMRLIVPMAALNAIEKLAGDAEGEVAISQDDNSLFAQIGNASLTARKLSGNFPDYARVLPKESKFSISVKRDELAGAINRVMQFSDERSRCIKLFHSTDGLEISASAVETGDSIESVECAYSGTNLETGFNGTYLSEFLSADSTDNVTLYLTANNAAMELRSESDASYRYVVMPMRI